VTVKEQLHLLVDELPDSELAAARKLLEQLRASDDDPVLCTLLDAPVDDEPEIDEEWHAVQEGRADLAAGRVVSHEEIKRELGL